ncbi:MAG TPA: VOC family protein, partial [Candidatus Acidoferrum sp.]|nr:VOC family protein [Candidatus Acidoferrum sp.]
MTTATESPTNPLSHIDWDYIEFYVGNAKQAAHYYMSAFGFDQIAYAGPETGVKDRVSYLLEQNGLRFLLTASLLPDDEIARHVALHGDGIKDVAIVVADARAAHAQAISGGARSLLDPTELNDENGRIVRSAIATYGETVHSFIQRDGYCGTFMPGFVEQHKSIASARKPNLLFVDHCVGNVGWGEMDVWGDYYAKVF